MANLSGQISYGHFRSPEQLEPETSVNRATASVTYNLPFGQEGNWASTTAYGQNRPEGESATPSWLVESTLEIDKHHAPFGRIEFVRKIGHDLVLAPAQDDEKFGITSFVLGYVYHFDPIGGLATGLGFRLSVDVLDPDLEPVYGHRTAYGFMVFFHLWPDRMSHSGEAKGHEHH